MRNALALIAAAALAATAVALSGPAQAHDRWPVFPTGSVFPRLLGNVDLTKAAHRLRDLLVVAV
jgi:hypothetical protein